MARTELRGIWDTHVSKEGEKWVGERGKDVEGERYTAPFLSRRTVQSIKIRAYSSWMYMIAVIDHGIPGMASDGTDGAPSWCDMPLATRWDTNPIRTISSSSGEGGRVST